MTELPTITDADALKLTLRKSAKLRHRTLVQILFGRGKSVYAGPLRFIFLPLSEEQLAGSFRESVPDLIGPVQIMITVPKKKRRHAVDRVLMRRRIREAFRLQYRDLRVMVEKNPDIRTLSVGIVYTINENSGTKEISAAVAVALSKIRKKLFPVGSALEKAQSAGMDGNESECHNAAGENPKTKDSQFSL